MPIDNSFLKQFSQDGYTSIPSFFNQKETLALQKEVERFKAMRLIKNVATDGDGETPSTNKANLQLIPLHDKSNLVRALPFEKKVVDAVTQLIGSPAVLHLDQMFLKPGKHGIGTSWHQDNAYFKITNPLGGTAMWVAIHDATIANGTLRVIPGSHREAYEHFRDPNSNHHIRCDVPEDSAVPIELNAGGVAFFCYGTAHCTTANNTEQERAGMAFHFLRRDLLTTSQMGEGRPIISGAGNNFGEQEYGTSQQGRWRAEVESVLDSQPNI